MENLYFTPIKLQGIEGNKKIESIIFSDNTEYGIQDIYTVEDDISTANIDETGMIFLYLPEKERTITINVDGEIYSGTVVTTSEENEIVTLNKV